MEHHQPALLNFCVLDEYLEVKSHSEPPNSANLSMDDRRTDDKFIGFLDVCIHQARDIHNICIYQNQDVYAKIFLTDEPEKKISSKVVKGGGRNPVFNENIRLGVRKMESSLRCEVWMLSRVKNYLEDQLLGFVLVPLSDVCENEKPAQEFELSSSDLFHSPAGFIELSLKCTGISPEVIEIPVKSHSSMANVAEPAADVPDNICCELHRIEFPDQEVVNENERMVSEYLRLPCNHLDPPVTGTESQENDNNCSMKADVHSLKTGSTNVDDPSGVSKSLQLEDVSLCNEIGAQEEVVNSAAGPATTTAQPLNDVKFEPEQKVVQEEIVDMYMKGMQQFTDALAKMKLPMDIAEGSSTEKDDSKPENSGSDAKARASKSPDPSPRVFYGSRAFF